MDKDTRGKEQKSDIDLLTVEEAACVLCVAPKTIRNWQYQKRLPYVKIFGAVRFKREDLKSLIEKGYTGD